MKQELMLKKCRTSADRRPQAVQIDVTALPARPRLGMSAQESVLRQVRNKVGAA